jgi:hypothetical protein
MSELPEYAVTAMVMSTDPTVIARAAEVLGRAVAGLALDGVDASLRVGRMEDES